MMPTRYLVTPHKGKLGRSRNIEPFEVEVESKPHNLDKIAIAINKAIHRHVRRSDAWVKVVAGKNPSHTFTAYVNTSDPNQNAGVLMVDTLE